MLQHLRVHNLGVLGDASIDPSSGFTVITGETGAGKTLLLGGLRLILGSRPDSRIVGPASDTAQVDALFWHGEVEIGATRTIPKDGRSRAHVDGAIVSAATLTERFADLVEIVGQHDQLSITRPQFLVSLIDAALDPEGEAVRAAYVEAWNAHQEAMRRRGLLGGDRMELARELDLARYQASEIQASGLAVGIDETLESDVSRLRNAEEIGEGLAGSLDLLESSSDSIGEVVSRLRKIAGMDDTITDIVGAAEGLAAGVTEMMREVRSAGERTDIDPDRLTDLEAQLTRIGELKRKYGKTLEEVISFGEIAARRVDEIAALMDDADHIDELLESTQNAVQDTGRRLGAKRLEAAETVSARALAHLTDLGLESATLSITLEPVEPGPSGMDRADLVFASDRRLRPGPVADVASGGELSRLVLALRLATMSADIGTLAFDEVDTGIGGRTALAMGRKLAGLATAGQVLCVTHLPQVAAHADTHYVVERAAGEPAAVRLVTGEDRVLEISRMLAGTPESQGAKNAAVELLESAGK